MNRFLGFLMCLFLLMAVGCDEASQPTTGSTSVTHSSLKIDFDTGEPQECDGPEDANCNAEGPGQRLMCDADGMCHYYESDEGCEYSDEMDGDTKVCEYVPCSEDVDCEAVNPDSDNLNAWCLYTEDSMESDAFWGLCFFGYNTCTVLEDTPCEDSGVVYCADNECACNAEADMTLASTELCDSVDNDCDGETDETFSLGDACDGEDSDDCENGTLTCATDQLGTECVNESVENIAETCNGEDDDCDSEVDEDFPTLGSACDADDDDFCENGTVVCSADELGVECDEVGLNVDEVCDGADNDCDGDTDEGCDDDEDGYCDDAMTVVDGASCSTGDCDDGDGEVNPGTTELCNSKDDNCDGEVDEGFGLGDACSDGTGVCLVDGTYDSCSEDGLSAVCSVEADDSQQLDAEICNGLDDTCDGEIDEGCDDDEDGYCDENMVTGEGAACASGDCDDDNADVSPEATEACDGADNDCDDETDEGCDDDEDGYCDDDMLYGVGAVCESGDCNDDDASVSPVVEEICTTSYDDNCDGSTEFLADGVTPACDSCANALEIPCGEEYEINMATEPNAANAIDTYQCWTKVGAKTIGKTLSAKEVVVVPDAEAGTTFSLQIMTSGTGTIAARLNSSCDPDEGTSSVSAYKEGSAIYDGTCAAYGVTSVSGGTVGEDFIALDAETDQTVTIKFTCVSP